MENRRFSISEEFKLSNTPYEVYKKCLTWCQNNKSSVLEKKEPHYLKAFYHGVLDPTPYLGGETIFITISEVSEGVLVKFQMSVTDMDTQENYSKYFWRFVRDFCVAIGVDDEQTRKIVEKIYGGIPPTRSIWREMNLFYIILILLSAFLISLYLVSTDQWMFGLVILGLGLVIIYNFRSMLPNISFDYVIPS